MRAVHIALLLVVAAIGRANAQPATPAPSAASQPAPTFASRVQVVRVDALVTEGSTPVTGLGPEDFEVLDNGVRQALEFVSLGEIPLNVVLVLDVSDSVTGRLLEDLRQACRTLIDALQPADQAAFITFAHTVTMRQRLTADHERLRAALTAADASGETALADAVFAGIVHGESDVGRSLVILFTDGLDTASWLSDDAVIATAKRSDAVIYGVSMHSAMADPFVEQLVAASGGSAYRVESTQQIAATFLRVLQEFRQRYLLGYTPRDVSAGGWHRIEVRVKGRRVAVKARPGYLASADVP
jgi:VWFA-related protein